MCFSSGSSTTTQSVAIPPEVLARYNSVNARAEEVAKEPFKRYEGQLVAPLTGTQQLGIQNTYGASQQAQPFYQLGVSAQNSAYGSGMAGTQAAYSPLYSGYNQGMGQLGLAGNAYSNAYQSAQPYFDAATGTMSRGLQQGEAYGKNAYTAAQRAQGVADPAQNFAYGQIATAEGEAQPYYREATQDVNRGLGAAAWKNLAASSAISQAPGAARALQDAAGNLALSSNATGQGYFQKGEAGLSTGLREAAGANKRAFSAADIAPGQAKDIQDYAEGQIGSAEGRATDANRQAMILAQAAKGQADPYQRDATDAAYAALATGRPYQDMATDAALRGGESVDPRALQIQRYLNPYTDEVVDTTYQALRQQQEQEMAGQTGNAIRSGAFGGDRAGLVAANLSKQQNLATAQALAPIRQQGYAQALQAAQQQQGVRLSADQANRAAQQAMAQQMLGIGQQGFGQEMAASQRLSDLGQAEYGRGIQSAQTISGLGQAQFGQALSSGQAAAQLGSQLYDQANRQAQLYSQLGNTQFQQQLGAAQQRTAAGQAAANAQLQAGLAAGQLGGQLFDQALRQGQAYSQLGNTEYQQNLAASQQRQSLGQGMAGLSLQSGQAAGQLGSQLYDQANRQSQLYGQLGQQAFGQNLAASQQQQALGQGRAALGMQYGQAQQGLGQQYFNQGQAMSQQLAGLGLQGYNIGSDTAKNYAALGTGAQQAALQGTQALLGAGTLQQQTQQAQATADYQQFLQERGYPFQTAQFLANIAMGTGALSGSTTTTTQPSSFFSDERLKEDITPVGETFDGQTIYRFRYKGEKAHQIGLIAQEVEKAHPEAVGRSQGFKTVDYDQATKDAAKIGLGAAKMERSHRAPGGLVAGDDLRSILAAQQQSFGPFAQAGLYGGTPREGLAGPGSYVPNASLPVGRLMTAGAAPKPPESGMSQLKGIVGAGEKLFGKEGLLGKGGLGEKVASKVTSLAGGDAPKPSAGGLAPSQAPDVASGVAAGAPAPVEEKGLLERLRDGALDVFGTASKALNFNAGGRTGYAGLGKVIDPMKLQNPAEGVNAYIEDAAENQDETGGLPKPGALPAEKSSGLSDALGLATKAAGLISAAPAAASAAGSGISALMAFLPIISDARLKDNIRPVGKTYDGQNIYAYDMGDGRTQMGLIAQEVARHKPEAVGRSGKYLTVDYNRATEDAAPGLAPRELASGGLVPRAGYQVGGPPEMSDEEYAIRTIAAEAGGPEDARAIAHVINNRRASGRWGDDYRSVVTAPKQFEPWNDPAGKNYPTRFAEDSPRLALARNAYEEAKGGEDITGGALHFYAPGAQSALGRKPPSWAEGREFLDFGPTRIVRGVDVGDRPAQGARPTASGLAPPTAKERNALYDFLPTKRDERGEESINWKKTLVPVLSGLGAMASSPSRYLGSAILQGLGAGAESYANLDRQEADIASTEASTLQTARNVASNPFSADNMFVILQDGSLMDKWKWYGLKDRPPLIGGPQAATAADAILKRSGASAPGLPSVSAAPTGGLAPSSPPPFAVPDVSAPGLLGADKEGGKDALPPVTFIGPVSRRMSDMEPAITQGMNKEVGQAESADYAARSRSTYGAANENTQNVNEMAKIVAKQIAAKGVDAPGSTFAARGELVRALNTLSGALGGRRDFGEADTQKDLLQKLSTLQGSQAAKGVDQRSLGALQAMVEALPSGSMAPAAQAELTAQIMMATQAAKDREAHRIAYGQLKPGLNSYARAEQAFEDDNRGRYALEQNLMKQVLLSRPKAVEMLATGKNSPQQIEEFFRTVAEQNKIKYVPGMYRYFMRQQ